VIDLDEAFDWLARPAPREAPGAAEVPRLLEGLWGTVRDRVGEERFDPVLGPIRAGKFGASDDHAWVQTNGDEDETTVNLTIELDGDELTLNLVGFYDGQFEKVRSWIARRSGRRFLGSHPDLDLVVFVKTGATGKGNRVMFKGAKSEELERMRLSEISPSAVTLRLTTLAKQIQPRTQKLALHVRKGWDRQEIEELDYLTELTRLIEDWMEELPAVKAGDESKSW
jgi:hypothetical protein